MTLLVSHRLEPAVENSTDSKIKADHNLTQSVVFERDHEFGVSWIAAQSTVCSSSLLSSVYCQPFLCLYLINPNLLYLSFFVSLSLALSHSPLIPLLTHSALTRKGRQG